MSNTTQPGAEDTTPEGDDTSGHFRAMLRDDSEERGETAEQDDTSGHFRAMLRDDSEETGQDDDVAGHGIPQWPTSESGTRP